MLEGVSKDNRSIRIKINYDETGKGVAGRSIAEIAQVELL
jgi:hypothetical protein